MESKAKQKILYHGSRIGGIQCLEPFPSTLVGGESVVFATTDRYFALAMIHGTGSEIGVGYSIDIRTDEREMCIQELQPGNFSLLHAPGFLYEVDGDCFVSDHRLCSVEFITCAVVPIIKEIYIENIFLELKKNTSLKIIFYGMTQVSGQ